MGSRYKWFLLILTVIICSFLHRLYKLNTYHYGKNILLGITQKKTEAVPNILKRVMDSGILFVETTDKVEPTPLAVCSVESAARLNPDKHVYYFMKGFSGKLSQYPQPDYTGIPLLSAISNVILLPLKLSELFEHTPLYEWHQKVNPDLQPYQIHILADGCRLALLWKYGGTSLDTDIISMKPLPFDNFTTLQNEDSFSNAIMGFHLKHHQFVMECMKDFIWPHQGPELITHVLKRWCKFNDTDIFTGKRCNGISLWTPRRFYPIPYQSCERYYEAWKKEDIESLLSGTYGAYVWNEMNSSMKKKVIAGSGSLIESLFQKYCPTTYRNLIQSPENAESVRA
ncbi:alpha-1,4-N-acetylglucosaminyltransferase-like [Scyliorhinus torazame]|uniref:alpha-1,4-N-acetylglucosaminyltransferase-like n=1 Tax=Scyliorhinus torazame TaxID=75743 RepID=UPI003B5C4740